MDREYISAKDAFETLELAESLAMQLSEQIGILETCDLPKAERPEFMRLVTEEYGDQQTDPKWYHLTPELSTHAAENRINNEWLRGEG